MKFEKNNPKYEKALRTYFDKALNGVPIQSICAIDDDGKILGGCGFTAVVGGTTHCFLLALDKGWATKEIYSKIQGFPFLELGAERVVATAKPGSKAMQIALANGATLGEDGRSLVFTKEKTMEVMKDPCVC